MKIQALYHFESFEGCSGFCENNGDYSWAIYQLVRQNGAQSSLEDFLHNNPIPFFEVRWYKDFKEISLSAPTNMNWDEPIELFRHRFDRDCRFGFAQDIMFHDFENSINVCYMEKYDFAPDTRAWEQGLGSSLDHQIKDLLKGSQPVNLPKL